MWLSVSLLIHKSLVCGKLPGFVVVLLQCDYWLVDLMNCVLSQVMCTISFDCVNSCIILFIHNFVSLCVLYLQMCVFHIYTHTLTHVCVCVCVCVCVIKSIEHKHHNITSLWINSSKKEKIKKIHKKSVVDSPAQRGVTISRPTTAEVR